MASNIRQTDEYDRETWVSARRGMARVLTGALQALRKAQRRVARHALEAGVGHHANIESIDSAAIVLAELVGIGLARGK